MNVTKQIIGNLFVYKDTINTRRTSSIRTIEERADEKTFYNRNDQVNKRRELNRYRETRWEKEKRIIKRLLYDDKQRPKYITTMTTGGRTKTLPLW